MPVNFTKILFININLIEVKICFPRYLICIINLMGNP